MRMPSRRQFLQTGAAVSAIAANGVLARSAQAVGGAPAVTLARAIYDDRYAEGRRFAAVVGAHAVSTRTLDDGDITRFWYDELEPLLRRETVAIAGFTQFGPMFVVERLAAERGMRSVLRVEHCSATGGTVSHSFAGPRETLALAAEFETRSDWPALMATLACRVGGDDSAHCSVELETSQPAPSLSPRTAPAAPFIHYYAPHREQQGHGPAVDGPLYSWVVAPPRLSR
jgi:hypothetical protein